MHKNFLFFLIVMGGLTLLTSCSKCSQCQPDYWADNRKDVFGRSNCVGHTGRWAADSRGLAGSFCTDQKCTPNPVNCIHSKRYCTYPIESFQ